MDGRPMGNIACPTPGRGALGHAYAIFGVMGWGQEWSTLSGPLRFPRAGSPPAIPCPQRLVASVAVTSWPQLTPLGCAISKY